MHGSFKEQVVPATRHDLSGPDPLTPLVDDAEPIVTPDPKSSAAFDVVA